MASLQELNRQRRCWWHIPLMWGSRPFWVLHRGGSVLDGEGRDDHFRSPPLGRPRLVSHRPTRRSGSMALAPKTHRICPSSLPLFRELHPELHQVRRRLLEIVCAKPTTGMRNLAKILAWTTLPMARRSSGSAIYLLLTGVHQMIHCLDLHRQCFATVCERYQRLAPAIPMPRQPQPFVP